MSAGRPFTPQGTAMKTSPALSSARPITSRSKVLGRPKKGPAALSNVDLKTASAGGLLAFSQQNSWGKHDSFLAGRLSRKTPQPPPPTKKTKLEKRVPMGKILAGPRASDAEAATFQVRRLRRKETPARCRSPRSPLRPVTWPARERSLAAQKQHQLSKQTVRLLRSRTVDPRRCAVWVK